MELLDIVIGVVSPIDPCLKNRPALVLGAKDSTVDLLPIESHKGDLKTIPSWAFALTGPACKKTNLLKPSLLSNVVIRVPRASIWARQARSIGQLVLQADLRFASGLVDFVEHLSCYVIPDLEIPQGYSKASGRSPLTAMTYQATPYRKLL